MMNWDSGWSWGAWLGMGLIMVVFWSVIVAAAVALIRSLGHRGPSQAGEDPLRILDQRFARGEITQDEYTYRRELLHTP